VFPPVEGLLRDTGFSNQGYHGFTAEHPVDHFPSEMWRVLVWHVIAPFEAHDGTTLVNNGQYLGVTSPGPKTGGRSVTLENKSETCFHSRWCPAKTNSRGLRGAPIWRALTPPNWWEELLALLQPPNRL